MKTVIVLIAALAFVSCSKKKECQCITEGIEYYQEWSKSGYSDETRNYPSVCKNLSPIDDGKDCDGHSKYKREFDKYLDHMKKEREAQVLESMGNIDSLLMEGID